MELQTPPQQNNGSTPSPVSTDAGDSRNPDGTFKKGVSGNPGGKLPGVSITAAIKRKLEEKFPPRKCWCECHKERTALDKSIIPAKPRTEFCELCEEDHEAIAEDIKAQKTYLDKVVETIFENSIQRKDQKALKDIMNYVDGLPKGSFDLGVDREGLAEITEFMKALANPKKE